MYYIVPYCFKHFFLSFQGLILWGAGRIRVAVQPMSAVSVLSVQSVRATQQTGRTRQTLVVTFVVPPPLETYYLVDCSRYIPLLRSIPAFQSSEYQLFVET